MTIETKTRLTIFTDSALSAIGPRHVCLSLCLSVCLMFISNAFLYFYWPWDQMISFQAFHWSTLPPFPPPFPPTGGPNSWTQLVDPTHETNSWTQFVDPTDGPNMWSPKNKELFRIGLGDHPCVGVVRLMYCPRVEP